LGLDTSLKKTVPAQGTLAAMGVEKNCVKMRENKIIGVNYKLKNTLKDIF